MLTSQAKLLSVYWLDEAPGPLEGGAKYLVFSDKDDKPGGPVCKLRTLKNPRQLEIVKSRRLCRCPGKILNLYPSDTIYQKVCMSSF